MLPDGSVVQMSSGMKRQILMEVELLAAEAFRTLALAVGLKTGPLSNYDGSHHPEHKNLMDPENFIRYIKSCSERIILFPKVNAVDCSH